MNRYECVGGWGSGVLAAYQKEVEKYEGKQRERREKQHHDRQNELDSRLKPFRDSVFALGLEPTDQEVLNFVEFLANANLYNHQFVFDTLRGGWQIIKESDAVSPDLKKKARLSLLRLGVHVK